VVEEEVVRDFVDKFFCSGAVTFKVDGRGTHESFSVGDGGCLLSCGLSSSGGWVSSSSPSARVSSWVASRVSSARVSSSWVASGVSSATSSLGRGLGGASSSDSQ
jgi:hypothetical protein